MAMQKSRSNAVEMRKGLSTSDIARGLANAGSARARVSRIGNRNRRHRQYWAISEALFQITKQIPNQKVFWAVHWTLMSPFTLIYSELVQNVIDSFIDGLRYIAYRVLFSTLQLILIIVFNLIALGLLFMFIKYVF